MTPEQISTASYLIEYRNPDGSLLLPHYGGCWHESYNLFAPNLCGKCGEGMVEKSLANPNLYTWPGLGELLDAMQAREDWADFCYEYSNRYLPHPERFRILSGELINSLTFPETVAAYLKGLER